MGRDATEILKDLTLLWNMPSEEGLVDMKYAREIVESYEKSMRKALLIDDPHREEPMIIIPYRGNPSSTNFFSSPWWAHYRFDGIAGIIVCCPDVHIGKMTEHGIDDDGVVTPSLVCGEDGCDWCVVCRLEGWRHHRNRED